ncbi:MAG: serine hydrolase [Ktedonobacterales bacterium]|nr:serine hydrolase [Ktedonobacterales bacterium]
MEAGETPNERRPGRLSPFPRGPWSAKRQGATATASAVLLLLLSLVVTSSVWPAASHLLPSARGPIQRPTSTTVPPSHPTAVPTGPAQWVGDTRTTTPGATAAAVVAPTNAPVDQAFRAYYTKHGGAAQFGAPVTPAFAARDGWIQFFATTALLVPARQAPSPASAENSDSLTKLIGESVRDDASGVVELPLLHSLLTAGSQQPLGGTGGQITYVDLRQAALPSGRVSENPAANPAGMVFIAEGMEGGKSVGHQIPVVLWRFITRADVSPDGWQVDFGVPLTEALSLTVTRDGTPHHELVQAFWETALVTDLDALDANGVPTTQRLNLGLDYLQTFGYPTATTPPGVAAWTLSADAVVRGAPAATGAPQVRLGRNWPTTLTGVASWIAGALWYQITWQVAHRKGTGWLAASVLTRTAPAKGLNGAGVATLETLSPDLAAYVTKLDGDAGVAIYDVTRNQWYSEDGDDAYVTGSSAKVPIMLAYLDWVERQGRGVTDAEGWLLTTMIENSNNDSAQTLFDTLGGDAPIINFLARYGLSGYSANPNGWGWATLPPSTMVRLLYLLYDGVILNSHDRSLAIYLMKNVESDQRFGLGDTAPPGAVVAMKDGWVPGPDGFWNANSSGIITVGGETYIISVYTTGQDDLNTSYGILQYICGSVVKLLT